MWAARDIAKGEEVSHRAICMDDLLTCLSSSTTTTSTTLELEKTREHHATVALRLASASWVDGQGTNLPGRSSRKPGQRPSERQGWDEREKETAWSRSPRPR